MEAKPNTKPDNVTVQYINNTEGMRQNFIVQKPLSEDEDLKLNFSVQTTLKQRLSSDRLQFVHEQERRGFELRTIKSLGCQWQGTGRSF
jgi:hypothetical protein